MGTFYTPESCEVVRQSAVKLGMIAVSSFWKVTKERLSEVMNGCGPDSWTDSMRSLASWVYRNFPEEIGIHDWDFEHSDGMPKTLIIVNQRFWDNAKIKLDYLYPAEVYTWKLWQWKKVYNAPVRAWAWSKLRLAFVALKNGSEEAWKEAHERCKPKEECGEPQKGESV